MPMQPTLTGGCSASDSIRITFDACTGLPESDDQAGITVSPNPACSFFTLEITGFEGGRWCLISITGARLAEAEIPREHYRTRVEVGGLPGGLYLLKVRKNDLFRVKKIILSPSPGK